MNADISLIPGVRQGGKTTALMREVEERIQGHRAVPLLPQQCVWVCGSGERERRRLERLLGLLVPGFNMIRFVTEDWLAYQMHGRQEVHLFVDDADRMQEGVHALIPHRSRCGSITATYTPGCMGEWRS